MAQLQGFHFINSVTNSTSRKFIGKGNDKTDGHGLND